MKTKKSTKSLALTKTALAQALSISRQSLYNYLRQEGAPERGRDGWDVADVARFIAGVAKSESALVATSDELKAAKLREIGLRCDLLSLEYRQKAGGYLNATEYEARMKKFASEVRWQAWEHWVQQFPADIGAHYDRNTTDQMIAVRQQAKDRFDSFIGGCHELLKILADSTDPRMEVKP